MYFCSFDLNKVAQAQGDKTARKQSQQLQRAAMDSLAEVTDPPDNPPPPPHVLLVTLL